MTRDARCCCDNSRGYFKRFALDVPDMASITFAVDQIIKDAGHIDVLVNNAGAGYVRTIRQASVEEINWVMDVNFMGVVRWFKAAIPHMRKAWSGHVITLSSVGGLVANHSTKSLVGQSLQPKFFQRSSRLM